MARRSCSLDSGRRVHLDNVGRDRRRPVDHPHISGEASLAGNRIARLNFRAYLYRFREGDFVGDLGSNLGRKFPF